MSGQVLERRVEFWPAFDKRSPEPGKNFGIGSMRVVFYVRGPKGAVQWMISLPFYTASVRPEMADWSPDRRIGQPMAWDLGYHAHEPQYEGQESRDCTVIGGKCFYDGSGLNAELLIEGFINGGSEWLWPQLESYYATTFDGAPWPFGDSLHDTNGAELWARTAPAAKAECRP